MRSRPEFNFRLGRNETFAKHCIELTSMAYGQPARALRARCRKRSTQKHPTLHVYRTKEVSLRKEASLSTRYQTFFTCGQHSSNADTPLMPHQKLRSNPILCCRALPCLAPISLLRYYLDPIMLLWTSRRRVDNLVLGHVVDLSSPIMAFGLSPHCWFRAQRLLCRGHALAFLPISRYRWVRWTCPHCRGYQEEENYRAGEQRNTHRGRTSRASPAQGVWRRHDTCRLGAFGDFSMSAGQIMFGSTSILERFTRHEQ